MQPAVLRPAGKSDPAVAHFRQSGQQLVHRQGKIADDRVEVVARRQEIREDDVAAVALEPGDLGLVIVSHANPEDNQFCLWLTLRLAREGYPVWLDLRRLLGGENFWNDIEETIRQEGHGQPGDQERNKKARGHCQRKCLKKSAGHA